MSLEPLRYYIDGLLCRDRRILSKTITLIESSHPEHQQRAREVIASIMPRTGSAIRIGISGTPGAGKSTLIEQLGLHLVNKGYRVAVLAVDPSSVRSGGSLLGDKIRMERLSSEQNAFIRPSPSAGTLGGVAHKTRETMLVCESSGFDVIIIETVGVGQSEAAVAAMVDFFLVMLIAGAGDSIQGIKRGILEYADALVINKADGENRERCLQERNDYEAVISMLHSGASIWTPPVLTCSALYNEGLDSLWSTVEEHRKKLCRTGELEKKRRTQSVEWMWSLIQQSLTDEFMQDPRVKGQLSDVLERVTAGTELPTDAAQRLLTAYTGKKQEQNS